MTQAGSARKLPDDSAKPPAVGRTGPGQREVGDLFSPFFRVSFKNVTKEEATPQNKGDKVGATAIQDFGATDDFSQSSLVPGTADDSVLTLDSRLLQNVAASLKMESKAGSPLRFTLILTPPYDDGIRILNNRLISFGTLVKVQWGYTGWGANDILSDIYVFRNDFPQAQFGEDIQITVSGTDLTAAIGTRNSGRRSWLFSEYPNDCEIVRAIVARGEVELDVTSVPDDSDFKTGKNRPTPEEGENVPPAALMQTTTDWAFVKRICRDHALSFTADSSKFRIFSLFDADTKSNYSYRFIYRQPLSSKRDIPVKTINGNLQPWIFLPPAGRGLVSYTYDPDTGKSMVEEKKPATMKGAVQAAGGQSGTTTGIPDDVFITGGGSDGEQVFDEQVGGFVLFPKNDKDKDPPNFLSQPSETHNAEKKVDAIIREAQAFSHPKVGVDAPGVVDVWPGITVLLEGTSQLFDGPYLVLNATHTISTSGYDMQLELMRHTVRGQKDPTGEKPESRVVTVSAQGDEDEAPKARVEEPISQAEQDLITGLAGNL